MLADMLLSTISTYCPESDPSLIRRGSYISGLSLVCTIIKKECSAEMSAKHPLILLKTADAAISLAKHGSLKCTFNTSFSTGSIHIRNTLTELEWFCCAFSKYVRTVLLKITKEECSEVLNNINSVLNSKLYRSLITTVYRDRRIHEFDVESWCLDALTYAPMLEPVRLPSMQIVDRSTIVQHLGESPHDPFTRQPMALADAAPEPVLQNKIACHLTAVDEVTMWLQLGLFKARCTLEAAASGQQQA